MSMEDNLMEDYDNEEEESNNQDGNTRKRKHQNNNEEDEEEKVGATDIYKDCKPMCTIGQWSDPVTGEDKFTVLIVLPSGVHNAELNVPASDDGTDKLEVKYTWCEGFIDMQTLFHHEITKLSYAISHPEIMSIKDSLKKYRNSIDETPISTIEVKLPIKVQSAPSSYSHDVIVSKLPGGNHLVTIRVRLTAFSTTYIIPSNKKKIEVSFM